MTKLPHAVTILSHEFAVVRVPPETLDGDHATVNYEAMEIRLSEEIHGNFLRETLLHEVLHIIDYYTGGGEGQVKERDIHRLSQVLFDTFQKNPVLVKRICKVR